MASQDMPNVSSQYGPITMDGQAHLQHGNPAQRIVVYDQIEDSMGVKRCRPVLHLFTAPEVSLAERPAGASLNLYEDYPEHHVHDGRISNLRDFLGDVVPLYGSRYGWWSKNIGVFEFIPVEHEASQQIVDTNQNSAMDPNSASSAASGPIDLTTMSRAELLQCKQLRAFVHMLPYSYWFYLMYSVLLHTLPKEEITLPKPSSLGHY